MKNSVLMAMAFAAMLFGTATQGWSAGLVARVDISSQTMTVSKNGRVIHKWRVSTARPGYWTPRGTWSPKRLHRMWYSRKYDMSPMPYSLFFYGGFAIHGTGAVRQLGRPASHGCVRLHPANARALFGLVRHYGGARVLVRA